MKVVILAGGKGTRISEESKSRPKPMVEIGGRPILWHIMRQYAAFGFEEFIVCCGYKGHMIKEYFVNYYQHNSQIEFHLRDERQKVLTPSPETWKVTLVDTGLETLTAGRILKIKDYIGEEPFLLTYGDGVSDVDICKLVQFHKECGKTVTISTTQPEGRFGALRLDESKSLVTGFKEKARKDQPWVNIGFMVMEPSVFPYLGDGSTMLEAEPFERLAADGEMAAYRHEGFWSPMDNIHDRDYLEKLWNAGDAPWGVEPFLK
ncbi:glucose-1-phosphate cytidylyltransferase [Lachnospiraceae bacterium 29-84]